MIWPLFLYWKSILKGHQFQTPISLLQIHLKRSSVSDKRKALQFLNISGFDTNFYIRNPSWKVISFWQKKSCSVPQHFWIWSKFLYKQWKMKKKQKNELVNSLIYLDLISISVLEIHFERSSVSDKWRVVQFPDISGFYLNFYIGYPSWKVIGFRQSRAVQFPNISGFDLSFYVGNPFW